jgi:hypothetical protein
MCVMARKKVVAPCARCGEEYERQGGYFCPSCRDARKREVDRARKEQRRNELWDAVQRVRYDVPKTVAVEWDKVIAEIAPEPEDPVPLVVDRQPVGWKSPRGSDDGRSTQYKDLANYLDWLEGEISRHPWWSENLNWSLALTDEGFESLEERHYQPACGDKRGSYAGYKRHRNAGELACPDCSEAKRLYVAAQRAVN